jgi:hypothetical protein
VSDIDKRLAQMDRRQERLINAVVELTKVVTTTNKLVVTLIDWVQKEPEGPRMIEVVLEIVRMVAEVQAALEKLPDQLAARIAAPP